MKADAQLIADSISVVTDEELENYESTGRRMDEIKASSKPKQKTSKVITRSSINNYSPASSDNKKRNNCKPQETDKNNISIKKTVHSASDYQAIKLQKVYIHIKNPNDHESLLAVKKICNKYPGLSEIILVLGVEKKSAIRMPFRGDSNSDLTKEIVNLLGEDCVVLK